jgi:hypothetical protein
MDTREEVLANYKINEHGSITSPGKFEGEMLYVPYLWEKSLDGCGDFDFGNIQGFVIEDSDRKLFPELADTFAISLMETDSGFVNSRHFATAEEWRKWLRTMEA